MDTRNSCHLSEVSAKLILRYYPQSAGYTKPRRQVRTLVRHPSISQSNRATSDLRFEQKTRLILSAAVRGPQEPGRRQIPEIPAMNWWFRLEVARFPKHSICESRFLRNRSPIPVARFPQNRSCETRFLRNHSTSSLGGGDDDNGSKTTKPTDRDWFCHRGRKQSSHSTALSKDLQTATEITFFGADLDISWLTKVKTRVVHIVR